MRNDDWKLILWFVSASLARAWISSRISSSSCCRFRREDIFGSMLRAKTSPMEPHNAFGPKKNDLVFGLWPGVLYISPSTSSSHWPGTCVAARAAANSHRRRQLELNGIKTLQLCGPQEVSTMILMVLGMVWQFFPWKIQGLFRLVFSRFPLGWHLCWGAFKFSVVDSAGFYRILIGFKLNLMTCEFTHGLQETRRDSWRRGVLWKFFTWFWQHA